MWKNRNLRSLIEGKRQKPLIILDFTTTPLPIPKIFLVVYLLNLRSECLVSYDPHFPGNDGTNKCKDELNDIYIGLLQLHIRLILYIAYT